MAVRFDAAADRLARTSGLIDYNAAYTWMAWVNLLTDLNAYTHIVGLNRDSAATNYDYIGTGGDGVSLSTLVDNAGAFTELDSTYDFVPGTWVHLAVVRASVTSLTVWINGVQQGSANARSVTARTAATRFEMAGFGTGNVDRADARYAFVKVYDAALSASDILAEMWDEQPQRYANLWSYARLLDATDILDMSGNGRDWTASGTLTREDGPPGVGWSVAGAFVEPFTAAGTSHAGLGAITTSPTIAGLGAASGLSHPGLGALSTTPAISGAGASSAVAHAGLGALRTSPTIAGLGSASAVAHAGLGAITTRPALAGLGASGGPRAFGLRFYGVITGNVGRARIPLTSSGGTVATAVNVGAGDFTYEMWVNCAYADNTSTTGLTDARYSNILLDRDIWSDSRGHVLGLARNGSNLVAVFGVAGGGSWLTIAASSNVGDGLWHHIAVDRRASTGVITLYVDGVAEANDTYTTGSLAYPLSYTPSGGINNEYIVLGTEKHDAGGGTAGYVGVMDELRISDTRRYTSGFTRPAAPFHPDSNTVGLYHMDEPNGTVLLDSAVVSGSPVHGALLIGGTGNGPTRENPALFGSHPASAAITTAPSISGAGASSSVGSHAGLGAITTTPALAGLGASSAVAHPGLGALSTTPALSGLGSASAVVSAGLGALTTAPTLSGVGAASGLSHPAVGALGTQPAILGVGASSSVVSPGIGGLSTQPSISGAGASSAVTHAGIGALATLPSISGIGATSAPGAVVGSGAITTVPSVSGAGASSSVAHAGIGGLVGAPGLSGSGSASAVGHAGVGALSTTPAVSGLGASAPLSYTGAGALGVVPLISGAGASSAVVVISGQGAITVVPLLSGVGNMAAAIVEAINVVTGPGGSSTVRGPGAATTIRSP